jgi:hypothetical protein
VLGVGMRSLIGHCVVCWSVLTEIAFAYPRLEWGGTLIYRCYAARASKTYRTIGRVLAITLLVV